MITSSQHFTVALVATILPALIQRPRAMMQWLALARTVISIDLAAGWPSARTYMERVLNERIPQGKPFGVFAGELMHGVPLGAPVLPGHRARVDSSRRAVQGRILPRVELPRWLPRGSVPVEARLRLLFGLATLSPSARAPTATAAAAAVSATAPTGPSAPAAAAVAAASAVAVVDEAAVAVASTTARPTGPRTRTRRRMAPGARLPPSDGAGRRTRSSLRSHR